jgi:hypothetical protein
MYRRHAGVGENEIVGGMSSDGRQRSNESDRRPSTRALDGHDPSHRAMGIGFARLYFRNGNTGSFRL